MSVSFEGFNEKFATFQCASGLTAGTPVKLTANGKVGACSKGERMIGVISHMPELRERIDKKIVVHKKLTGSEIELEY